ncbi:MAG: hypothetical protein F4X83_04145 [Chloroflexi bacterium]|nr:hypothetical protein [Chloroflexota bacterium]
MAEIADSSSTLVVDVGTFSTRVSLLERVEGEYRLAGAARVPSTIDPPVSDVMLGVSRALTELERTTGWHARHDVVNRLAVTSVGLTAVTSVLSLGNSRTLNALLESLQSLPITPIDIFDLNNRPPDAYQFVFQRLIESPLDVLIILGSETDQDWEIEIARMGEIVRSVLTSHRSAWNLNVVFIGAAAHAQSLRTFLGERASIHHMNLEPGQAIGDTFSSLESLVQSIANERRQHLLPNHSGLSEWAGSSPIDYQEALGHVTQQLAQRYSIHVLSLDLGASHVAAIASLPNGDLRKAALDGFGTLRNPQNILMEAGREAVERWLPYDLDETRLDDYLLHGLAHPGALPTTIENLVLEHAFAREALRGVVELIDDQTVDGQALAPCAAADVIIGCGATLGAAPRLIQAVMMMLDAVLPTGFTQLALDRASALPVLLLDKAIEEGNPFIEQDVLLSLGVSIAPTGRMAENRPALRLRTGMPARSPEETIVNFGAMEVIPWEGGAGSTLEVWPATRLNLGVGRGRGAEPRANLFGGSLGLIVDARGRPIDLDLNKDKRQAKILEWMQTTGAYPTLSFSGRSS